MVAFSDLPIRRSALSRVPCRRVPLTQVLAGALLTLLATTSSAGTIARTSAFDYDNTTGLLTKEVIEPSSTDNCLVTVYQYGDGLGNKTQSTTRNCNGSPTSVPGGTTESPGPLTTAPSYFAPRTTTYAYTGFGTPYVSGVGRFPTTVTNAENYQETRTYDLRNSQTTSVTGPNGLTTYWAYDQLGRAWMEYRADTTYSTTAYSYCNRSGFTPPTGATSEACNPVGSITPAYVVTSITYLAPAGTVYPNINFTSPNQISGYVKVYYDGLGREIRSAKQGFDGSGAAPIIYQDTQYNSAGQVAAKSRPYPSTYSPIASDWTTYTYDVLSRVLTVKAPTDSGGTATTTSVYNGLVTTVTDANNHSTTETRDVAGQLVSIVDANSQTLTKTYDAAGNLKSTTDAFGNVTSFVYDARGRKTSMADPDMGAWSYVYNAAGELRQQTDAKGQVIAMTYDLLGRMVARSGPGLNGAWYYNKYADGSACAKGIGKLCEATGDNGYDRKHNYDSLGRPSSTTSAIGSTYAVAVDYDSVGRINTQTYPTGVKVKNVYTALGYLKQVNQVASDGVTLVRTLWTASAVNERGQVTSYTYGNNVVTTNSYFAPTGRLSTTVAGTSGSVQNLAFGYDPVGLLNLRGDSLTQVYASYAYDALNRLQSETRYGGGLPSAQATSWSIDAIGNINTRTENGTVVATYAYNASGAGSVRPHAVNSISGSVNGVTNPGYAYDANGNITSSAGRGVTWTGFDKVSTLTKGTTTLTYQYDPELQRAKEVYAVSGGNQRSTVYLNPADGAGLFYEEDNGPAVGGVKGRHYLNAGGATIALLTTTCSASPCSSSNITATTIQYWHKDQLGSTSVITDASGAVIERLAYEPFGKRRNSNGVTDANGTLAGVNTDRGFTGHEHMDEVGLINMNGRVYDPAIARFLSADPIVSNSNGMQAYNRYTYVWNSPFASTDPSGYCPLGCFWHNKAIRAIAAIAVAVYAPEISGYIGWTSGSATAVGATTTGFGASTFGFSSVAAANGLLGGAMAGFVASGGKFKDTFVGGVSGGLLGYAGDIGGGGRYAMHAGVGCGRAAVSGGNCGSGAISALASVAVSDATDKAFQDNRFMHASVSIVAGGTMSKLTGGSFTNGAVTAAFQYAFNAGQHKGPWYQRDELSPAFLAAGVGDVYLDPSSFQSIDAQHSGSNPAKTAFYSDSVKDYDSFVEKVADPAFNGNNKIIIMVPPGRDGQLFVDVLLDKNIGVDSTMSPTNAVRFVIKYDGLIMSALKAFEGIGSGASYRITGAYPIASSEVGRLPPAMLRQTGAQ